jgi:hypothetical protein
LRAEAKQRKAATQWKKGESGNPEGKQVHLKSGEPAKRDVTAEHSRSTAGQLAERVGVSRHKAVNLPEICFGNMASVNPNSGSPKNRGRGKKFGVTEG